MNRPIRIARIVARTNVGGPAVQIVNLTRGFDPRRVEQLLLAGQVAEDEADYLDVAAFDGGPSVAVTRVPGLGRSPQPFDDVRALRELCVQLRAFAPDVVHTHTSKAGTLGRLAAIRVGIPTRVHTFHGHLLHGYFSPPITAAMIAWERLLATRTTRLLAVGDQVRVDLLAAKIGQPAQYLVVPPGISVRPTPSRAESRAALGLHKNAPVIAFVGRLATVKRVDRLADVVDLVARSQPGLQVLVAGDGPQATDLKTAAQQRGLPIQFLGWRPDVSDLFAAADVALLTSDNEGMPVSLIEAALHGCPAVTTRVGSAAEVVIDGQTGFVTTTDPHDLATQVCRLLTDPVLRNQFGLAAKQRASREYTSARLVADHTALYESLTEHSELKVAS